ncbi:helix-turn-helix domain-containing protein [bacterium]|nr:helix-turn-helix domain-containing protein [bacterium]
MENDKQPNEVMNGDEAAVFLKMPKSTLLKLCSEGQLPGVKVGRQWRFHRDALEKWNDARNAENNVATPDESVDFSQSLTKAVSRVDRNIKPVVEEFVGSVGGDDFDTTGEVREFDDSDEFVSEVKVLPATKPTKGAKKQAPSALELMAQISEKTQGRRPGRPPKAKTAPQPSQPAPVQETASREKRSEVIRETFRDKSADTDAVEISRPYTKSAPGNSLRPQRPNKGNSSGIFKKLIYSVLVLGVLAMAGMGIKNLLIPISILDSVAPTASAPLPKLPALPEIKQDFQVVYQHNDPEEATPASTLASDKATRPIQAVASPVVQPTPVTHAAPAAQPALAAQTSPAAAAQPSPAAQTPPVVASSPVIPSAPEVATHTNVPIAPPPVDRGLEAINKIRPQLDQLPGCIVYSSKNEIRIMFQEGIFPDGGLKIDKNGRAQLSRVAEFLTANAPDFWLIIEGQTNIQSVRSSDNYTLGLRRAFAATEIVRNSAKFPSERLMMSSAGGSQPPFAVSVPGAEGKNRTVLFRLVPKTGDMPSSQQ